MANYAITNSSNISGIAENALTGTYQALICIAASSGGILYPPVYPALRRGKLYDILVGTNGTPADNYIEWEVVRATVGTTLVWVGSISSISSALALDPADIGCAAFTVINTSAQTNVAATIQPWYVGVNQRASYRWVAAPGSEIVYPAASSGTGTNGLALEARSVGYTGTGTGTLLWQEQ
jgi:hypothetical protein